MLIAEGAAARFAVMFLAGALLFQVRNVIPARWSLVALSVAIVLAASLLPNYRWIAAFRWRTPSSFRVRSSTTRA